MSVARGGRPYVWVTWLTAFLAGEAHCQWAPWFKARHRYTKVPTDFDLAAWSAEHDALVTARAHALTADGWLVRVEDQNAFKVIGQTAVLSGKPDIAAIRSGELLVVDCKTGQQRHKDWWQMLVYFYACELVAPLGDWTTMRGELQYLDRTVPVEFDALTPARRSRIIETLQAVGQPLAPASTPSAKECGFCDITGGDCSARVETEVASVEVVAF